ncbi:DUF551 domain-containing protein [Rouxiella sp. WC2420]|uniref:DUF551 domain-containing protein n=1 Tax=Rouxiella sp. WC2420 TaxID=3234145 RepID=A0AB39VM58_9GAMM
MNLLDSFTVERLEDLVAYSIDNEVAILAKIALAVKLVENQHVRLEVNSGVNNWVQCSEQAYKRCKLEGKVVRKLYELPQIPQPPDGWVMVPKEPTIEMREAFHKSYEDFENCIGECPDSQWSAMLAAAPKPDHIVAANEKVSDVSLINEGNNGWIKCSDRMPEPCEPVNFYVPGSVEDDIPGSSYNGHWDDSSWLQDATLTGLEDSLPLRKGAIVTHWMPLPAAPKPE